jgi:hypothetical protein
MAMPGRLGFAAELVSLHLISFRTPRARREVV